MPYTPQTPQEIFDIAYVRSKRPDMQTLWQGSFMDPTFENVGNNPQLLQLSDAERQRLITSLLAADVLLDLQIDVWQWDPYTTMQTRLGNGQMWTYCIGQGPTNPVAGSQTGPPPPGTLLVSINPADFPAYPSIPPAPLPAPSPDPIGILEIAYGAPHGVGDLYQDMPGDPRPLGTMFTDSRGTFSKDALPELMGKVVLWRKIA